ncbi:MAG: hypothetical protein H3Z53_00900 [archaeon]|nr:hypothetical protein [archaeon]MCP8321576.1 hypothetical protein [archaeon]
MVTANGNQVTPNGNSNPLGDYRILLERIDWSDFERWIKEGRYQGYAKDMFNYAKKFHKLLFSNEFVEMPNCRRRINIQNALSNLTKYLDIKFETNFHDSFLKWIGRKGLKWNLGKKPDLYALGQRVKIEEVITRLNKLPENFRLFGAFALVSGLRTLESVAAFNNHDQLCEEGIMELFWDRGCKKANVVYCHPLLHESLSKCGFKMTDNKLYKAYRGSVLGFQFKMLRKINFTINARKVDPLLAEFMQGRRGNISERHYFLPLMTESYEKWLEVWTPIIKQILGITG